MLFRSMRAMGLAPVLAVIGTKKDRPYQHVFWGYLVDRNAEPTVENCIFSEQYPFGSSYSNISFIIYSNTASSIIFNHCIFLNSLSFNIQMTYLSLPQVIFSNCIFSGINSQSCFPINTAFDNNLFINSSISNSQFCNSIVGLDNIMNAPNPFVNGDLTNILTANFDLNASSAGNNAASDGTDIGLHGGENAWPFS